MLKYPTYGVPSVFVCKNSSMHIQCKLFVCKYLCLSHKNNEMLGTAKL